MESCFGVVELRFRGIAVLGNVDMEVVRRTRLMIDIQLFRLMAPSSTHLFLAYVSAMRCEG